MIAQIDSAHAYRVSLRAIAILWVGSWYKIRLSQAPIWAKSRAIVFTTLFFTACLTYPQHQALANNVQLVSWVYPYSGGNGEVGIDLSWENSWRTTTEPYNWDAVWVFGRIRINGGNWAPLKLNITGHTIPSGVTTAMGLVDTSSTHDPSTNPAIGIFVYRSNDGFGTFTIDSMKLQWSYADNGASSGDNIDIRVIGVEMVYVPEAAFYAGDNATSTSAFREKSTGDNDPWYISSENALTTTSGTTGNYYYPGEGNAANSVFTIPAAFPKGYGAFYMMKGEISQSQWVAFFNMLTTTQKSTRNITSGSGKGTDALSYRNNVSWTSGDATLPDRGGGATYAGVAVNFISWPDLTAYLDWAGLRPMSELEYEKAGRGPKAAVSGEYAWGSTSITRATSISNAGLPSERAQSGSNAAFGNAGAVQGPLRVGSFASGTNTRVDSGGGFYGAMELSGNLWEKAVTVGTSTGRGFNGAYHGDGELDTDGDPNVSGWPGTTAAGSGFRGGVWYYSSNDARLSDRNLAAHTSTARYADGGGRGVRTAP